MPGRLSSVNALLPTQLCWQVLLILGGNNIQASINAAVATEKNENSMKEAHLGFFCFGGFSRPGLRLFYKVHFTCKPMICNNATCGKNTAYVHVFENLIFKNNRNLQFRAKFKSVDLPCF